MLRTPTVRFLIGILLAVNSRGSQKQAAEPSIQLKLGSSEHSILMRYGEPFEWARLEADDDQVRIGVPAGLWKVYHLTAGDRMYVTMLHFTAIPGEPNQSQLDSLMLEPNGHWTVLQILGDQPELQLVCRSGCEIVRITHASGTSTLLLQPRNTDSTHNSVVYFEGDSGTIQWTSVSSLDSSPSWVYVLRSSDFDARHADVSRQRIGTWRPSVDQNRISTKQ